MSKDGWKLWIIPLGLWALYSTWYFGYQSGYSDGHQTAWKMYEPMSPAAKLTASRNAAVFIPDPDDFSDSEVARQ